MIARKTRVLRQTDRGIPYLHDLGVMRFLSNSPLATGSKTRAALKTSTCHLFNYLGKPYLDFHTTVHYNVVLKLVT